MLSSRPPSFLRGERGGEKCSPRASSSAGSAPPGPLAWPTVLFAVAGIISRRGLGAGRGVTFGTEYEVIGWGSRRRRQTRRPVPPVNLLAEMFCHPRPALPGAGAAGGSVPPLPLVALVVPAFVRACVPLLCCDPRIGGGYRENREALPSTEGDAMPSSSSGLSCPDVQPGRRPAGVEALGPRAP